MSATEAQVAAALAIDIEHRPASISVERDSITCVCGHESSERYGLASHRAQLAANAVVTAGPDPAKVD